MGAIQTFLVDEKMLSLFIVKKIELRTARKINRKASEWVLVFKIKLKVFCANHCIIN